MKHIAGEVFHGGTMARREFQAFDGKGNRKYLTREEGIAFLKQAKELSEPERLFCQAIYFLGCRVTEATSLLKTDIDLADVAVRIKCLKKRGKVVYRRVPVPEWLAKKLSETGDEKLWSYSRTTAWRTIKAAMNLAGIEGIHASPKGLRHGFGVRCAMAGVPVNVIQRWMGHADPMTTAIYLAIEGKEERELIGKTWDQA